jgi:hypothetical protein
MNKKIMGLVMVLLSVQRATGVDLKYIKAVQGQPFKIEVLANKSCDWEITEPAMLKSHSVCIITPHNDQEEAGISYAFMPLKPGKTLLVGHPNNPPSKILEDKEVYIIDIMSLETSLQTLYKKSAIAAGAILALVATAGVASWTSATPPDYWALRSLGLVACGAGIGFALQKLYAYAREHQNLIAQQTELIHAGILPETPVEQPIEQAQQENHLL